MAKQTKNLITRESCKKDLMHTAKADLRSDLVFLAVALLLMIPFIIMSVSVAKYILVLDILIALIFVTPPAILICMIVRDIMNLRLVASEGFSIVKDTVYSKIKGETPRNFSEGRHTVDVLNFKAHGRCVASGFNFEMSSVGDEFYLVVMHNKNKSIAMLFHSMMYECNETDKVNY